VTGVVPSANVEPDGGTQTAVAPGLLSVTVGAGYVTTAVFSPLAACTVTFCGQVIVGGCVSARTVTVKEQLLALPVLSVAVQDTVVVPTGKAVPDAGVQKERAPGQLSEIVGEG